MTAARRRAPAVCRLRMLHSELPVRRACKHDKRNGATSGGNVRGAHVKAEVETVTSVKPKVKIMTSHRC